MLAALGRATALMGVPTFYTRLLAQPGLTAEAVAGVRLFVSGSAPLLAETHQEWSERTGHAILERYGMTETNMNTSNPYDGERRAGTVGFPLPGVELRVVDAESGAVVGPGRIGVLEVRGPNVFAGYWRQPEKTAEDLRPDGFFVTGDLVEIDDDGYVHIVGRAKDLIISGGLNVYPKEVEDLIDALPGVAESAVFGVPHPDFGEAVVAAVVPRAGRRGRRPVRPRRAGRAAGPVQAAQGRVRRRRAAPQRDGQGPEGRAAGGVRRDVRVAGGAARPRTVARQPGWAGGGGGAVPGGSATAGATSAGATSAGATSAGVGSVMTICSPGREVHLDRLLVGGRRATLAPAGRALRHQGQQQAEDGEADAAVAEGVGDGRRGQVLQLLGVLDRLRHVGHGRVGLRERVLEDHDRLGGQLVERGDALHRGGHVGVPGEDLPQLGQDRRIRRDVERLDDVVHLDDAPGRGLHGVRAGEA